MIRRKYQNEGAKPDKHGRRPYLKATDFYVGGTIKVLSRKFKLLSADTFTMVRTKKSAREDSLADEDSFAIL